MYVPEALAGIGDVMSSDTRPKLWAFYGREGESHTWTGVGFGKPLPGRVFQNEIPPALLETEPQALTHAHNLFLNTWLETGIVGVVLEAALLLALIWRFWRLRHVVPWLSAAGMALVIGMIAKNFTDDFMWQTTALAFWSFFRVAARSRRASGGEGCAGATGFVAAAVEGAAEAATSTLLRHSSRTSLLMRQRRPAHYNSGLPCRRRFSALRAARAQVQSCSARRPTSRTHGFTIKDTF